MKKEDMEVCLGLWKFINYGVPGLLLAFRNHCCIVPFPFPFTIPFFIVSPFQSTAPVEMEVKVHSPPTPPFFQPRPRRRPPYNPFYAQPLFGKRT